MQRRDFCNCYLKIFNNFNVGILNIFIMASVINGISIIEKGVGSRKEIEREEMEKKERDKKWKKMVMKE